MNDNFEFSCPICKAGLHLTYKELEEALSSRDMVKKFNSLQKDTPINKVDIKAITNSMFQFIKNKKRLHEKSVESNVSVSPLLGDEGETI